MISDSRRAFRLYCLLFALLTAWLVVLWRGGLVVENDILALLPPTEQDPVVSELVGRIGDRMAGRMVFLIGHQEPALALGAAEIFESWLGQSAFTEVTGQVAEDAEKAFYQLYFPARYQLLDDEMRAQLADGNGNALLQAAERNLYSPMSSIYSGMLPDDPLLLFASYLRGLPKPPGNLKVRNGWLSARHEGHYYIMLTATTSDGAFHRDQAELLDALAVRKQELTEQFPGLEFLSTGLPRYAAAGTRLAQWEVSIIGAGSLLGVLLLFIGVFRGLRQLLLGLLPILTGLLTATVCCFAVFGKIHLMTLGFGASLIGICIDYAFHYFCERIGEETPRPVEALRAILPGISLGALTSIMGYLGLFPAPFPGLRQMALFSASGLIGAFLCVVLAMPHLAQARTARGETALKLSNGYLNWWRRLPRNAPLMLLFGLTVLSIPGLLRLRSNDDIRALQQPDKHLLAEEQGIRAVAGSLDASRFLLVEGTTVEEVLQREEALRDRLEQCKAEGQLAYYQSVTTLLPSRKRQMENHRLLRETLLTGDTLTTYLDRIGFEPSVGDRARAMLIAEPAYFLDLESWLQHPVSAQLGSLWLGETERGFASSVILGGLNDEEAMTTLAGDLDGVHYIDKVAEVSQLMKRYRAVAGELVVFSYLAIFLLLIWRHGFLRGLLVALPPIVAALATLGLFGWLGLPISLFNLLALLLVLGIGIDYTIFFAESGAGTERTMLAVMLSATTTLLSFGFLALSQVGFLMNFGLTVVFGISLAWLLSPLSLWEKT